METHAAYCASKSGLVGMTCAVALEGAPFGVNCIAISPTWVETEMPQKRLVQPSEIAALAVFCCTDAAPGLTMEDIQVNAGALW